MKSEYNFAEGAIKKGVSASQTYARGRSGTQVIIVQSLKIDPSSVSHGGVRHETSPGN